MKKQICLLLFHIIAIQLMCTFSVAADVPKIQFDTLTYSFHTVNLNQKVTYNFKFKNVGTADLVIKDIKTSCDCAAVENIHRPVPPNGEGEIIATLSTGSTVEDKNESIFVYSNVPKQPPVELKLYAQVVSEITIIPSELVFSDLSFGHEMTRQVTLINSKDKDFRVDKIVTGSPNLIARISSQIAGKVVVSVTVNSAVPVGHFSGNLKIYTNNKIVPVLDLPVSGDVQGSLSATPDRLFFGVVKKGENLTRTITISGPENLKFSILKVESQVKGLSFKVETVTKGTQYKIYALLNSAKADKEISDRVIVHTDFPRQPTMTIPVFALVQ